MVACRQITVLVVYPVPKPSLQDRWISLSVGGEVYELLNLNHPEVEQRILDEMGTGIRVYYDRRWEATEIFGNWVLHHPHWVEGKRILVLGAGVGLETVVLGRHCERLFINDLAPVALELCVEQLARNRIHHVETLPGLLETLTLPEVDLVIACFLIYNRETRTAIRTFVERWPVPLLLVNESLPEFQRLLVDLNGCWEELFVQEAARGVLVSGNSSERVRH